VTGDEIRWSPVFIILVILDSNGAIGAVSSAGASFWWFITSTSSSIRSSLFYRSLSLLTRSLLPLGAPAIMGALDVSTIMGLT
jgi:hypothetical protein